MQTFLVCLAAYLLVGFAFFQTWMFVARQNDRREYGEDLDGELGPIDPAAYAYFSFMTMVFWPVALGFAVNGWWRRRQET
jgi:hypothetical protein